VRLQIDTKNAAPSIRIGFTDQRLTAHGGLIVWSHFLRQKKFRQQLREVLPHDPTSPWRRNQFCRGWLITGDTGSGKTSSGINQLAHQVFQNEKNWGGLCVDEKGVYWETLSAMAHHYGRVENLIHLQIRTDEADLKWKPPHRFNLTGDRSIPFSTYSKFVVDNRGVAGELLLRRAEKIKTRFGEDIRIGRFAGFDLFIRSGFNNTAELVLRGKNSYSTRVTDTALGTIRSLESVVQGLEERATRLEADIKDSQKRATELEAKVGSPFEKEERYHHLARRQSEIEEQLDLTKNQAPSQVDAAATNEREENSEKQTETKSMQQTRRAAVRI